MPSQTKRRFLVQFGALAANGFFGTAAARLASADPLQGTIWSVDAAGIRVAKGAWGASDQVVSGVHFESLYLRQPDGVRLHALLYLPMDVKHGQRVPTALESDPYRREPFTGNAGHVGFWANPYYLARSGYAAMYLGVRGSGTSEGIPSDEYPEDTFEDDARVIAWIARQPWSNGHVGMHGISYSAINSVWLAADKHPPALKALFVRAGTDVRYTDDVHYPGGTMVMINNAWALGMLTDNATPGAPDYEINSQASLDRWNTPPWLQMSLRNQLDGPYWRRVSLSSDYSRLTTPTFLAGGYLDKYQNFVPRIMKYSPAPTKGVLGPWHHSMSWPGPVPDWDAMMVRWFDHWLRGRDTGVTREPRASFYLPRWQRQTFRSKGPVPGEWRHLQEWPDSVFNPSLRFYLRPEPELSAAAVAFGDPAPGQGGRLAELSGPPSALQLRYYADRGGTDQSFGPTPDNGYYGIDHRDEDAYGLAFDTPPLSSPLEILGFARAALFVSASAPIANWIVRLHDVAPDGTSYLITRGFLNGTHRHSHARPEPLVAGEIYEISVELMCTAYTFPAGHRVRVVVTNADFPVIWPSPYRMTTMLYTGGDRPSHVMLPILPPLHYSSASLPLLGDSVSALGLDADDAVRDYKVTRDYATGQTTASFDLGSDVLECRVSADNPAEASLHLTASAERTASDGRRIETRAVGALSSTASTFNWSMDVTLLENGKVVRERRWQEETRRELL
jgi:uncharacterized protein